MSLVQPILEVYFLQPTSVTNSARFVYVIQADPSLRLQKFICQSRQQNLTFRSVPIRFPRIRKAPSFVSRFA